MSPHRNHMIQRQVVELEAITDGSPREMLQWEKKAAEFANAVVLPALEECFAQFDTAQQYIIDRMELDLGEFSEKDFQHASRQRLIQMLQDKLSTLAADTQAHARPGVVTVSGDPLPRPVDNAPTEATILNPVASLHQALLYFLKQGRLPWWFTAESIPRNATQLFPASWLQQLASSALQNLIQVIHSEPHAQTRIIHHFSSAWIGLLLKPMHGAAQAIVATTQWAILSPTLEAWPHWHARLQHVFWRAWLQPHFATPPAITAAWIAAIAGPSLRNQEQLCHTLAQACTQAQTQPALQVEASTWLAQLQTLQKNIRKAQSGICPQAEAAVPTPPANTAIHTLTETLSPAERHHTPPAATSQLPPPDPYAIITEPLFVDAAGLVLLHPFLEELCKTNDLWHQHHWVDDEAAYRTLQYLSFLCYGDAATAEYQLSLPKILTGLTMDTPLPPGAPLTAAEQSACMELLQAVCSHWKALGNTHADGLREGFLQRRGKLEPVDRGYRLTVERKTQDVLLSHLPWGCSLIKLPWMPQKLHVSWF